MSWIPTLYRRIRATAQRSWSFLLMMEKMSLKETFSAFLPTCFFGRLMTVTAMVKIKVAAMISAKR